MSEIDDRFVKLGYWVNWSKGPVMGKTITTDAEMANLIIALLTVLITLATAQLWNLFAFLYHQLRATGVPSDGLFWQQQALLRTLPPPTSLIADSMKLWWIWRHKSSRPFLRSLLLACFALLFSIGAVSSGIFSTYVLDSSNLDVLVQSPFCGKINISNTYEPQSGSSTHFANLLPVTKSYAHDCYQNKEFLPSRCHNTFVRPNVSFSEESAECPWEASMCASEPLPALSMDSGFVDETHFGFNLGPGNGIKFRKKTECNILPLDGFYKVSNATEWNQTLSRDTVPQEEIISLHYFYAREGEAQVQSRSTFQHSLTVSNVSTSYHTNSRLIYMESRDPTRKDVDVPLASMNRTDADIALNVIWLNNVQYSKTSDDELFSAHQEKWYISGGVNFTSYRADKPGAVIGCTNQYQFCIARNGQNDYCTPLEGLVSTVSADTFPGANDVQLLILQLLRDANLEMDISTAPLYDYTQAGEIIQKGSLPGLPNDQWKKEAIGWEAFAWAGIQIRLSDYAIGPKVRDPAADAYVEGPSTAVERGLCGSMKMRKSGGFANINVFGLAFIITFSLLVTILNLFILRFFIFLSRFRRALAPRLDRWVQDGVFHLQRRAFDAAGEGTWVKVEEEIPSTIGWQVLSELPVKTERGVVAQWRGLTPATTFGSEFSAYSSEKGFRKPSKSASFFLGSGPQIPNASQFSGSPL